MRYLILAVMLFPLVVMAETFNVTTNAVVVSDGGSPITGFSLYDCDTDTFITSQAVLPFQETVIGNPGEGICRAVEAINVNGASPRVQGTGILATVPTIQPGSVTVTIQCTDC